MYKMRGGGGHSRSLSELSAISTWVQAKIGEEIINELTALFKIVVTPDKFWTRMGFKCMFR